MKLQWNSFIKCMVIFNTTIFYIRVLYIYLLIESIIYHIDPTTANAQVNGGGKKVRENLFINILKLFLFQGPDVGTQYRSVIFYHSPEQKEIAERVTQEVQEKHYKDKKIVTQLIPAGKFYDAEEYHQVINNNNNDNE